MSSYQFTEIIQYHSCVDFLKDSIILAAMPIDKTYCIFEFPETRFLAPAHSIKLFYFFQRKVFFRKIGCDADISSVIKTDADNPEFNIIIRTLVIQEIKYRNIIFYYLCVFLRTYNAYKKVSRPRELPPKSLSELYVNLSAHTAPIIQPLAVFQTSSAQTDFFLLLRFLLTSVPPFSSSYVSYIFFAPSI